MCVCVQSKCGRTISARVCVCTRVCVCVVECVCVCVCTASSTPAPAPAPLPIFCEPSDPLVRHVPRPQFGAGKSCQADVGTSIMTAFTHQLRLSRMVSIRGLDGPPRTKDYEHALSGHRSAELISRSKRLTLQNPRLENFTQGSCF